MNDTKGHNIEIVDSLEFRVMTRQEAIGHWKDIAMAVFHAEDKLKDVWLPQLREAKHMSKEEREHIADRYLEAVATEIVSETTDKELEEL